MRTLRALVLLVVLGLTACSDGDSTPVQAKGAAVDAVTPADLVRREWRIDAATDADGERQEVDPTHDAVLRFDGDGAFSGQTCNHTGGEVTIDGSTLVWGNEIFTTSMLCGDEDLMWLERTVGSLLVGTSTWTLADGALRIEGNDVTLELSERPDGFPTELVQLATSDPSSEAEWQLGYTDDPTAEASGGYRYFLTWEGREAPGTAYGSSGMAVDPDVPLEAMWLDDVEGHLFPLGTLPIGTASAVFESADGSTEPLHPYALPDGRLVYGERVNAAKGQVVALDAAGNEIERGRVVPAG